MDKKEVVSAIIEEEKENLETPPNLTEARETAADNSSLGLAPKSNGKGWAGTLDNLEKILSGDSKLKGALQYNEFTYEIDITKPLRLNGKREVTGVADDVVLQEIRLYISKKYKVDFKKSDIVDTLSVVAGSNAYNPLKSYLLECEEEYKHLPEQKAPFDILRYYLNVEDDEYNRLIFDLFFRGAVAKVFEPGVKFDFVLDLTGRQGVGKTQFFEGLFDGYFTTVESFTDKDDKARMVRNWCVFDDEMVATKVTSFSELKKFITERRIEFRPPYASTDRRLFKNFVIVRATNEQDYLNDQTGERRFLVAEVHKDGKYRGRSWSDSDRRAFWGGMVTAWRANKTLTLTEQQEKLVSARREKYMAQDDELDTLKAYLALPYPSNYYLLKPSEGVRAFYISNMLEYGEYLGDDYDPEKHGKLIERDRVNVVLYFQEIREEKPTKQQKNKIKMALQNLEGWEWKKAVKFGKSAKSGYKKQK